MAVIVVYGYIYYDDDDDDRYSNTSFYYSSSQELSSYNLLPIVHSHFGKREKIRERKKSMKGSLCGGLL